VSKKVLWVLSGQWRRTRFSRSNGNLFAILWHGLYMSNRLELSAVQHVSVEIAKT
jgi:hypothetical protein